MLMISREITLKKRLIAVVLLLILPSKGFACVTLYENVTAHEACSDAAFPLINGPNQYEPVELKSRPMARIYSAVFTTVPIGLSRFASKGWKLSDQSITSMFLLTSGAIFGPSAGSIYADDWGIIRNGIISRSLSMSLMVGGSVLRENHADDNHLLSIGRVLQLTGLVFFAGSAIYDTIVVSAHSVDYHNATIRMGVGASSVGTRHHEMTVYPDFRIHLFF
jgi:hypothetical protein